MWFVMLLILGAAALFAGWRMAVKAWEVETPRQALETGWYRLNPPRSVSVGALQQRIMRAAVGARVVSVRGVALVPSTFEVRLHPDDLVTIEGAADWIATELAAALTERAEQEGWQMQGRPIVAFVADDHRTPGRPEVRTRHESRTISLVDAPPPTAEVGWLRPLGDDDPVALTHDEGVVLGRGVTASIDLADTAVSRRHCEIRRTDRGWMVTDLGSANGTCVNDVRITSPTPLRPGDVLSLAGAVVFVAESVDPATRVAPDTGTMAATRPAD